MEALNLDYLEARPVVTRQWERLSIALVGCGGTGSWLSPHIGRFTYDLKKAGKGVSVFFIDPDTVESENIPRQNFCHAELGANKAQALALRYGLAWGINVIACRSKFSEEVVPMPNRDDLLVIVGCVDNAAARRDIHNLVHKYNKVATEMGFSHGTWWLDCGNAENSGQVLFGSAAQGTALAGAFSVSTICKALPAPTLQRPELLVSLPEEGTSHDLSCAQIAQANAQSLAVNIGIAAVACQYLVELLLTGNLRRFATYIDLPSGVAKSLYTTPEAVAEAIKSTPAIFESDGRVKIHANIRV